VVRRAVERRAVVLRLVLLRRLLLRRVAGLLPPEVAGRLPPWLLVVAIYLISVVIRYEHMFVNQRAAVVTPQCVILTGWL
jgi:hypothetical protein